MAESLLPPAVQEFIADSGPWVASVSEMIAITDQFTESIARATEMARAMQASVAESVSAAEASAASAAAGAGAGAGAGADASAAEAAATAQTALSDAEKAAADAAHLEAEMQADLAKEAALVRDASLAAADAQAALSRGYQAVSTGIVKVSEEQKAQAVAADESAVASSKAGGALGMFGSISTKALLGFGAAVALSVHSAMGFNSELTRLQTAAGLTNDELQKSHTTLQGVGSELLKLGDQYGYTGTQMAEAMYHPISAGLNLQTSLNLVAQAANLANIHGANLEDTTYALSSVMKAFNQNASDAKDTAALLNSIVGQGDMRFQDFNQSVKNWAPTAASMGISIQSMGSAIAYLTDRGNSAEVASTRLTMGLSMMTSGSKQANAFLHDLGLTADTVTMKNKSLADAMNHAGLTTNKLAADLKKPDGVYVALKDLQTALTKSGASAQDADAVMSKIFGGGRSDKAIMSLMQNLDGLKGKYSDIGKAVSNYGAESKKAAETPQQQWKDFLATVKNLGITFGTALMPMAVGALHAISSALGPIVDFASKHQALVSLLGKVVGGILLVVGALKAWKAIQAVLNPLLALFDAEAAANPIGLIAIAIAALVIGLIYAYNHFSGFRHIVQDVFGFIKTVVSDVVGWLKKNWELVLPVLMLGPFGILLGLVIKNWDDIKNGFMDGVHAVINWLKDNWKVIVVILSGPLAPLVAAIIIFWKQIKDAFIAAGNAIKTIWNAVWPPMEAVLQAFATAIEAIWSPIWTLLKGIFTMAWDAMKGLLIFNLDLFKGVIKAAFDLIVGIFKTAWELVKNVTIHEWNALKDLLNGNIQGAINEVKKIPGDILSALSSLGTLLLNSGKALIYGLITGIKDAASSLWDGLKSIASSIYKVMDGLYNDMLTVGHDIIVGIWNGLVNMSSWLMHQVESLIKDIIPGPVAKVLGISSPSKLMASYGVNIGQGLAQGMLSQYSHVHSTAKGLAQAASAGMGGSVAGSLALNVSGSYGMSGSVTSASSGGGGFGAGVAAAGGMGTAVIGGPTVIVNVHGSVTAERDLVTTVQQAVLRTNLRNPSNNLSLAAGRGSTL